MSLFGSFLGARRRKKSRQIMDDAVSSLKSVSPNQIKRDMGPFQNKINDMSNRSNAMFATGTDLMDKGAMYADPMGSYQQDQIQQLSEQTGDISANTQRNQTELLAQTQGLKGGGISSLLDAVNQNKASESLLAGTRSIRDAGLGSMQKFTQMGIQTQQAGSSLLSSAASNQGKLQENIAQSRIAQQNLENQKNMQLAQSSAEQNQDDGWWESWI